MKIFLADHENLFPLRVFILQKMFLTLNFIISCLCNLDCLANSLFALISIFKVLSGVKFPGPGLQHLLSFQPGLIQGIHTVYPRLISHWSLETHLTLFRFMPSAWQVSSSCYLKALRVLLSCEHYLDSLCSCSGTASLSPRPTPGFPCISRLIIRPRLLSWPAQRYRYYL